MITQLQQSKQLQFIGVFTPNVCNVADLESDVSGSQLESISVHNVKYKLHIKPSQPQ